MNEAPRERLPEIPGFQLIERLGSGGVGSVYLAKHLEWDRLVAVKVLRRELAGNRLYVARLEREARLSARLDHPNIVKGLFLGEHDGVPFFVMEFVDGKTLKTLLKERGRLEEDEVIDLALQVARALDHAYRHGVVHRDIKPGNLLLARDGMVKLADLGLARRPDDSSVTRDGTTLGTPHYVSPEQARDPVAADTRSDLYSLGATLFHAAAGQPPFDSETVGGVLSQVLDERLVPEFPENLNISRNLRLVLRRLLAKDPARRYQTPDDLIRDLERVRRNERPNVSLFDVNPTAKRGVQRALWITVGCLVLGAGGYGIYTLAGAKSRHGSNVTEPEVAAFLEKHSKPDQLSSAELARGLSEIEPILAGGGLSEPDRVRAASLRTLLGDAVAARLQRLEDLNEQELDALIRDRRLADAAAFASLGARERIRKEFGGAFEQLPSGLTSRVALSLDGLGSRVRDSISRAEADLGAAISQTSAQLRMEIVGDCDLGRFQSAATRLRDAAKSVATADGIRIMDLPEEAQFRSRDRLETALGEVSSVLRAILSRTSSGIIEFTQSEHDRLRHAVEVGRKSQAAAELEIAVRARLEAARVGVEPWPSEFAPDPAAAARALIDSLRSFERARELEALAGAFSELDRIQISAWRGRRYSSARDAWVARAARFRAGELALAYARRLESCETLIALRARALRTLESKIRQKVTLTLRGGGAISGKLMGVSSEADDWIATFAEGNEPQARYSSLGRADIEALFEPPPGPIERALWCVSEGEFDAAQAVLAAELAREPNGADVARVRAFLEDLDAWRRAHQSVSLNLDQRISELLQRARDLASVGEMELARSAYAEIRGILQTLDSSDPRSLEIGREIREFDAAQDAAERGRADVEAFFGAQVRDLDGGRVEAQFSMGLKAPRAMEIPPAWSAGDGGIRFVGSVGGEVSKGAALRLAASPPIRAPFSVEIRIAIPFATPTSRVPDLLLTCFGRSALLIAPRGRAPATAVLQAGSGDQLEAGPRRFGLDAKFRPTPGLILGATHTIELQVSADLKATILLLDGKEMLREDLQGVGDGLELRANGPMLLQALTYRGFRR
ncbi:MAG: serine/threonine protein kinase [Planctomycetes bacterium]|nr:serine/threonine protein kinase [Planctomycetota bacterium]